jgi:hypothetical protein
LALHDTYPHLRSTSETCVWSCIVAHASFYPDLTLDEAYGAFETWVVACRLDNRNDAITLQFPVELVDPQYRSQGVDSITAKWPFKRRSSFFRFSITGQQQHTPQTEDLAASEAQPTPDPAHQSESPSDSESDSDDEGGPEPSEAAVFGMAAASFRE